VLCGAPRPQTTLHEAMYQFHSSILDTDYFVDKMCGNTPYEITPKVFQKFSDRYWREEARIQKEYMDEIEKYRVETGG